MNALRKFEQEPVYSPICNVEGEGAIIGSILLNNDAYQLVAGILLREHFYDPVLGEIFEVIGDVIKQGKVAQPISIKPYLPWDKNIDSETTVGRLVARCVAEVAMPSVMLPQMAQQLIDLYKRRQMVAIAQDMIRAAHSMAVDSNPAEIGEQAIADLSQTLSDGDDIYGAVSLGAALDEALDDTNRAYSGKKGTGVSYRFRPVEELIGPMCGGQLIILGGATKQGKSALAGQLAMGAATEGFPVWFYSGEMSAKELAMRENSRETQISVNRQKRGKLTENDFERLMNFRNANRDKQIFIQQKRLTLDQIEERIRYFVSKKGKGLAVIDHMGLIDRNKGETKLADWEFGQIVTARLKQIAREVDIPIIGCAQLKKNVFADYKPTVNEKFFHQLLAKKPRYSDLIGAIERDADHVLIPFRPVVFLKEYEPSKFSDLYEVWKNLVDQNEVKAKVFLALSRESQWPRDVECGWHGPTTTFVDLGGMNEPELIRQEIIENPLGLNL
ncbi:replicative DNA helicase [Brucella intermedia]|uniref:replicative DNA helicase n=1 Tax=Brucella intermedia TaxID=94625 RepID=UPI000469C48A|nr:DnaB-like helicase C-terminal domain-containing protein [Brucella intermedia]